MQKKAKGGNEIRMNAFDSLHHVIEKSMESLERKSGRSPDRAVMEIWDDQSSMRLNQSNENSS